MPPSLPLRPAPIPGGSERADRRSLSPAVGATDHSVYYNEHDPFAAAWLRELMADGLIAPGVVDERSIEDVRPDELAGFRQCHFFAGIGVWSLALRNAGWSDDRPVWTGSCPCQPFSAAGKGGGFDDERHLWPAFHWLIHQCRPELVLGEQVASKDGLAWLDLVSADLEASGYASGAVDTCAAGFGAPHIRQRLYWVAHATGSGQSGASRCSSAQDGGTAECCGNGGMANTMPARRAERWSIAGNGQAAGVGGAIGMADAAHLGHEWSGAARGRRDGLSHGSDARWMADADGGNASAEGIQRGGEHGQQQKDGRAGGVELASGFGRERGQASASRYDDDRQASDRAQGQHGIGVAGTHRLHEAAARPGPTNGLWRAADWLGCTDGKWRPVEPGTQPLADAGAFRNRVAELRGAGNALTLAQAQGFVKAVADHLAALPLERAA